MTHEIKIIHQLSLNKIFEVGISSESDLKAWIANGRYLVSDTLVPLARRRATEFKLRFHQVDILYVSMANEGAEAEFKIYDILGKEIKNGRLDGNQPENINLQAKGVFILKVSDATTKEVLHTQKIIVQ